MNTFGVVDYSEDSLDAVSVDEFLTESVDLEVDFEDICFVDDDFIF